jgi:hypothetical protein
MMVPRDADAAHIDVLSAMDEETVGRMDVFDEIDA